MKPDSPDDSANSADGRSPDTYSSDVQSGGDRPRGDSMATEGDAAKQVNENQVETRENPYTQSSTDFESLAGSADPGLVREFVDFLQDNKKWWLAPILIVTLILVGLVFLSASPAAPFIYTLF